ncbi:MAG: SH3 domain-containing protein [Spirochaetaceae bacterium]|nr:MAG: SH3 domain-containing protein [Spirochaetaceae bacterium]
MKRLGILLVVLCSPWIVWTQQIDLPLLGRASLNIFSAMTFYEHEGSLLTDGISQTRNRLVRIGLGRGQVTEYFDVHRFLGAVDKRILVSTVDRDHILKLRFVDPSTLAGSRGPDWKISVDWALLEGPKGTFYCAQLDNRGIYAPYRFDPGDGSQEWLNIEGVPTSLTADSLHLLIQSPDSGEIFIWSTEEQAVRARLRSSDPAGQVRFLTNSVLLLPPQYAGQELWRLYNVEGSHVGEVRFRIPGADPLFFWFTADLRRAVVCIRGQVNPETAVVNSEGFRHWLQREGHLFTATRGVLNDNRVRVRAFPTLRAEILDHLEKGDRVEVLDRSGRRERIGEMSDYWYLVRKEDGPVGWSYGHFIDLQ